MAVVSRLGARAHLGASAERVEVLPGPTAKRLHYHLVAFPSQVRAVDIDAPGRGNERRSVRDSQHRPQRAVKGPSPSPGGAWTVLTRMEPLETPVRVVGKPLLAAATRGVSTYYIVHCRSSLIKASSLGSL